VLFVLCRTFLLQHKIDFVLQAVKFVSQIAMQYHLWATLHVHIDFQKIIKQ